MDFHKMLSSSTPSYKQQSIAYTREEIITYLFTDM